MKVRNGNMINNTVEPKVKSLYKAMTILNYFNEDNKELGITEIAQKTGMLKSTVHNIMQTFECCGFVVQNYDNSKYKLGSSVVELFSKYRDTHKMDYRVSECLQQIKNKFNVNVYLGVKNKNDVIYLCAENSFYLKGDYLNKLGARVPLHCTGIGKILLGYSTADEREQYYSTELTKYTDNTIVDMNKLKEQIENAVYEGYATEYEEMNLGVYSIGVPIIIGYDKIQYGIGLASNKPFSEYELKEYVKELKYRARYIGSLLQNYKE